MITLALIIAGTARDTVFIGGQEFALVKAVDSGTVLWTGNQNGGTISMTDTVKTGWKNVADGILLYADSQSVSGQTNVVWSDLGGWNNGGYPFRLPKDVLLSATSKSWSTNLQTVTWAGKTANVSTQAQVKVTPGNQSLNISITNLTGMYSYSTEEPWEGHPGMTHAVWHNQPVTSDVKIVRVVAYTS